MANIESGFTVKNRLPEDQNTRDFGKQSGVKGPKDGTDITNCQNSAASLHKDSSC